MKKTSLCRNDAAAYLGVSANTLAKYPIPFVQYMDRGNAIYNVVDLKKFKDKYTKTPARIAA